MAVKNTKTAKYDDLAPFFDNRHKEYRDLAKEPLFQNDALSYQNRKNILECFPFDWSGTHPVPDFDKVYSPFTTSADPLFLTGVPKGQWNQRYGPFTIVYLALREYFRDFTSMVDGKIINSTGDFEEVKADFNQTWQRILSGKGSGGVEGTCSVPEAQRLAALFYILQRSSRHDEGIAINNQKNYDGSWCGKKVVLDRSEKVMKQYQAKLDSIHFSDVSWKKFFMRFTPKTDKDTLWYIKLPNVYDSFYSRRTENVDEFEWFDIRDFPTLVDFLPSIHSRGGKVFLYTEDHDGMFNVLYDNFSDTMQVMDNVYSVGDDFYIYRNLGVEYNKFMAISNYSFPNEIIPD